MLLAKGTLLGPLKDDSNTFGTTREAIAARGRLIETGVHMPTISKIKQTLSRDGELKIRKYTNWLAPMENDKQQMVAI
jgi:hypothetical protein